MMIPGGVITLISVAASAAVSGIVGYLIKRMLDKHFQQKEALEEQKIKNQRAVSEKIGEERKEDIEQIITNSLEPVEEKIDQLGQDLFANTEGTITILRDRMKTSLDICRSKGYASTSDKANWNELYKSYKTLGGNHFREYVDQGKKEMEDLPIKGGAKN